MLDSDWYAPRPGQQQDVVPETQREGTQFETQFVAQADGTGRPWDIDAEFEYLFQPPVPETAPPPQVDLPAPPPLVHRRRRRPRVARLQRSAVIGGAVAGISAVATGTVSVLSAMVAYGPMRQLAAPTTQGLAGAWPLLVYGPWLVGCLSILNAATHRRTGRAGWVAMILFSMIATALCVIHAPRTITASAVAGLPPFSALTSFLLLSRQITLLRPRHAKPPPQTKHPRRTKLPRQRRH
ncbi:DUF2637 domain-containing protein [Actinacidiphila paucisporea]|uniref:DUF2637 domain-containing protein n=1 Tax=Actinacidiphila paucisporea TaxID=310782 RepID=UPI001161197B|nr:DUF2637 domain-containing protein [Actinacidiphila paucisporea]